MERLVLDIDFRKKAGCRSLKNYLWLAFLFIGFSGCYSISNSSAVQSELVEYEVPEHLRDYYADLEFTSRGSELHEAVAVHTIGKHTNFLSYGERHNYLYDADADPNDSEKVILIYSGESRDRREWTSPNNPHPNQSFNTEHVYPQSMLEGGAVNDLHILRVVDARVNSQRSNRPFDIGAGAYELLDDFKFYPGDEWRGDVARMIMYMNLRYDEPFEDVGNLQLFLKWNALDPVSEQEEQRNLIIMEAQGNRNPFVDNPHLATRIWGGPEAENKWKIK